MAKVNIEFDSQTKDMSVKIDGNDIEDVRAVHIYRYEDDPASLNIMMRREDVDGFEVNTTLYASQNAQSYASKDKTLVNIDVIPEAVNDFLSNLIK